MSKGSLPGDAGIAPEIPAERESNGRFRKGHKITAYSGPEYQRLRELRTLFWSIITDDDARQVWDGIIDLAFHGKDERVRLAALLHLDERMLGKVSQPVSIDVNAVRTRPLDVELSASEQEIIERVMARQVVVEALPATNSALPETNKEER